MRTAITAAAAFALLAVSIPAQAADKVSLRTDWIKSAYHAIWYRRQGQGNLRQKRHRRRHPRRPGLGDHRPDRRQQDRHLRNRRRRRGDGAGLQGAAGEDRLLLSQDQPGRHHLPHEERLEGLEGPRRLADRLLGGRRDGGLFQGARQEERDRGQGQAGVHGSPPPSSPRCCRAKVDAIDSFGFLQAPKATAAGIPSTYFSYASGGIVVPGLSLIAHNDTIEDNADLVRRMVASRAGSDGARPEGAGGGDRLAA